MTRVLVTGASGFVGRPTVRALAAAGFEVHAVARAAPADAESGVRWHEADLLAPGAAAAVAEAAAAPLLVGLAWSAEPGRFWTSPDNARWVGATLALLAAWRAAGGRRAVLAGTCAEYAWTAPVLAETAELRPATLYSASKHATHVVAAALAAQDGWELAWARLFFVYGPGDPGPRLIPSVAEALARGAVAETSSGGQRRDFLHVDDAGAALAALAGAEGVTGAVNVASGEAPPVRELAGRLAELAGRPDLLALGALPGGEEPACVQADVTRLREEVGFAPRVGVDAGLRATLDWWRARVAPG